jgi:hypothetical protein
MNVQRIMFMKAEGFPLVSRNLLTIEQYVNLITAINPCIFILLPLRRKLRRDHSVRLYLLIAFEAVDFYEIHL